MRRKQLFITTIIGLSIIVGLSACGSQAQQPQNGNVAQSQRDVTYAGVGGVTLAGTLVIPAHKSGAKVPGVIIIAGQVATMTQGLAHPPAALVLISAPGRPIDVVLREQIAHQLAAQPTIPADFVLSKYDEIITSLRQTGKPSAAAFADLKANSKVPAQLTQNLETLFIAYNDEFWQGELKVDPAATLKHYAGPVLVLQGASDVQMSASEDTPLLDAALKSRTPDDHQITIIPDTSHNMKAVQNPATDPGITGPVVSQCTNTLRHWLAEKL